MLTGLPQIAPNERACFMGPTGSGKTELAAALLKTQPNVIVIDPKHGFDWHETTPRYRRIAYSLQDLVRQRHELEELEGIAGTAPIIYRPPADDLLPRNIGAVDRVFKMAFDSHYTLVYMDELIFLAGHQNFENTIPGYFRCVTQGRARGVAVWSSFQRPSRIPLVAVSESDVRCAFHFRMDADRRRAEELCGPIDWDQLARNDYTFVWATDKDSSIPVRMRLHQHNHLSDVRKVS